MKPRVLVTSYYDQGIISPELERLLPMATLKRVSLGRRATVQEMIKLLQGVTCVMMSDENMTTEILQSINELRMISCDGVGVDSIDLDAATRQGVIVNNAPEVHEANGDFALGLILALLRKIVFADRDLRVGRWNERQQFVGHGLRGRTLGLLGFGRSARNLASKAIVFGPEIIAYCRNPDSLVAQQLNVRLVEYQELIQTSDILSVHVTLTEETRGMLGQRSLWMMKQGAYLVNTSRGAVLDEIALAEALKEKHLAGAALDVLVQEPPNLNNPLLAMKNVILTPHIASDSNEAFRAVFRSLVDDFLLLIDGWEPRHVVNPAVLSHANFVSLIRKV